MKIQIDLDSDLWNRFREKVHGADKTLAEVVPTVFEPALKLYLDPPQVIQLSSAQSPQFEGVIPNFNVTKVTATEVQGVPIFRRCELCDMPSEKLFASGPNKVCYNCWKSDQVSNSAMSSGQTSSSASGAV